MLKDKKLKDVAYYWIERAMREVTQQTKQLFKEQKFGITKDQWILLKRISEVNGISQVDLANSTFKEPAAVTRMIDILERKKLVERKVMIGDRRAYEIHLTSNGLQLVNKMTPFIQELRAKGLSGLSEDEINSLKRIMDKIYHNFK